MIVCVERLQSPFDATNNGAVSYLEAKKTWQTRSGDAKSRPPCAHSILQRVPERIVSLHVQLSDTIPSEAPTEGTRRSSIVTLHGSQDSNVTTSLR
jgi:hypothetical protein